MSDSNAKSRQPFNWRLFWVLCGLNTIGMLLVIPFSLSFGSSLPSLQGTAVPRSEIIIQIVFAQMITALVYCLFIVIGLMSANRTDLGSPILAGWLTRNPVRNRLRSTLKPALIIGVALPIVNHLIIIPTRLIEGKTTTFGFSLSPTTIAPRWQLFLGAISAGITEEILFRLFMFSLLVWVGSLIIRSQGTRPTRTVFWIVNILSALLFGLFHLSTANLDIPISVIRSIGLNSLGGLAFGWLYFSYGLESAMIGHALADIVFYIIAPCFISF